MEDQAIIRDLVKGHEESIKYLYKYLNTIEKWVIKNNGTVDDALDLFQEAMIVFYKKVMANEYQVKGKISTYLFEICKRQWYNVLNRRKKRQVNMDHLPEVANPEKEPIMKTPGLSLKEYLNETISTLGNPCQDIIEMAVVMKLSMSQIAEKLGYASAHSARQQKLRCLQRLRKRVSYKIVIELSS
jgi:RNA polymerase sigma factor (sigma-70 family)